MVRLSDTICVARTRSRLVRFIPRPPFSTLVRGTPGETPMSLVTSTLDRPASATFSDGEAGLRKLSFFAMGTPCAIQYAYSDSHQAARFEAAAFGWVNAF